MGATERSVAERLADGQPQLIWRRQIADTETPVAAALKLIEPGRGDFLLESVEGGATRGRYSLIGLAPDLGDSPLPLPNAIFDHRDGRIIPPGTPPSAHASPISGGALAILRHLVDTSDPADLRRLRLSPGQIREIAGHLDLFATWHLDLRLPSRTLALDLLTRSAAA